MTELGITSLKLSSTSPIFLDMDVVRALLIWFDSVPYSPQEVPAHTNQASLDLQANRK